MKKRIAKKKLSGILQGRSVKSEHILNDACRRLNAHVYLDLTDNNKPYGFARRRTKNTYLLADRITKIYYYYNK